MMMNYLLIWSDINILLLIWGRNLTRQKLRFRLWSNIGLQHWIIGWKIVRKGHSLIYSLISSVVTIDLGINVWILSLCYRLLLL